MPNTPHDLIGHIKTAIGAWRNDPRDDAELLDRIATVNDDMAFRAILWRHGPMVWKTCQRVLGDTPDAEDACQTAFLVLVRKASKLRREPLAGWLHRVARQSALNVRASARRRQDLQHRLQETPPPKTTENADQAELYAVMDEELSLLPERLRVPLVLRYLEGKTLEEAAHTLGCSRRDLGRRLEKGELVLRKKLERRGLALGAGSVTALLEGDARASAMPVGLIVNTSRAAMAFRNGNLTDGAAVAAEKLLRSLSWKAVMGRSWWLVLACVGALGLGGAGLVAWKMFGDGANSLTPASPNRTSESSGVQRTRYEVSVKSRDERLDCFGDPLPKGALARIGTLRFRHDDFPRAGDLSVARVAFGPDGKTIFSTHDGNIIYMWETTTGRELHRIQGPLHGILGGELIIAFSPIGKQLVAVPRRGGDLWSWDIQRDLPRLCWKNTETRDEEWESLAFSLDNKMLACGSKKCLSLRNAATGKELLKLNLDKHAPCENLTFSPDTKVLASWGRQNHICLWEVATGVKLRTLNCDGIVGSCVFSPDSSTLAVATSLDTLQLWNVASGMARSEKVVRRSKLDETEMDKTLVAYLPDDKTLLTTENKQVRFLDPVTGKDCRPALMYTEGLDRNVLSPDGRWLASANRYSINVYDLSTGRQVGPTTAPESFLLGVAFSRDGKTVATDMFMGAMKIWDAETGKLRRQLTPDFLGHSFLRWSGLCYAGNNRLYTLHTSNGQVYRIGTLIARDARTGAAIPLPRDNPIEVCWAVTQDGRLAAVRNKNDIVLYELETGKELRRIKDAVPGGIDGLLFSNDGRSLVALTNNDRTALSVWDIATGRPRLGRKRIEFSRPFSGLPQLIAISPDGRWLAAPTKERLKDLWRGEICEYDGAVVQLWEVASGTAGPRLPIAREWKKRQTEEEDLSIEHEIRCLAFAPDGRTLACGADKARVISRALGETNIRADPPIWLWDLSNGQEIQRFTGHRGNVLGLAFAPDGSRLASASEDGTALIWELHYPFRPTVPKRTQPTLESLWADLTGPYTDKAYYAICQLVESPKETLSLLKQRLKPPASLDSGRIAHWLADLDDNSFEVRKRAMDSLEKCDYEIENALKQALEQKPSLEVRMRLEKLLTRLQTSSTCLLPIVRGVEVLERIGTPEARQLLEEWARSGENIQAEESRAALERLGKRRSTLTP